MIDALIVDITKRTVVPKSPHGTQIANHMAGAIFDSRSYTALEWQRIGTQVIGEPHPSTAGLTIEATTVLTSAQAHVVKRIKEGEWQPGTTPDEYVTDLKASAAARVRVKVGGRPQRNENALSSTTSPLNAVTGIKRAVVKNGLHVLVVCNAVKSRIVSGYCVPEPEVANRHSSWTAPRPMIIPL